MKTATICFYPVENGDTALIALGDGTTILIDCNISQAACDDDEDERHDVKSDLIARLREEGGIPHLDVLVLTHPDQDHCRGLDTTFWLGEPTECEQNDDDGQRIVVDELWFAPRVFNPHEKDLCEEAKAFKAEADRRISLFRKDPQAAATPGNRIRVIGYSDNPDLDGLSDVMTVPGNSLNLLNGSAKPDFEFFVLAPIKKDSDSKWADRNDTSIVFAAMFTVDGLATPVTALFGGDAGCAIWERIWALNQTSLPEWDLLLAPHHCSWTFFSESASDSDVDPSEDVLSILERRHAEAKVVASCKSIADDDDNPPHYRAAKLYKRCVGTSNFICTAANGDQCGAPQPVLFELTAQGVRQTGSTRSGSGTTAAIGKVTRKPQHYGQ